MIGKSYWQITGQIHNLLSAAKLKNYEVMRICYHHETVRDCLPISPQLIPMRSGAGWQILISRDDLRVLRAGSCSILLFGLPVVGFQGDAHFVPPVMKEPENITMMRRVEDLFVQIAPQGRRHPVHVQGLWGDSDGDAPECVRVVRRDAARSSAPLVRP